MLQEKCKQYYQKNMEYRQRRGQEEQADKLSEKNIVPSLASGSTPHKGKHTAGKMIIATIGYCELQKQNWVLAHKPLFLWYLYQAVY